MRKRRNPFFFQAGSEFEDFSLLLKHSLKHSLSEAAPQVSLFTMIRPPTSTVGLLLLLIGYAAAGKGCSWGAVWRRGKVEGSKVTQEGAENAQLENQPGKSLLQSVGSVDLWMSEV